MSASTTIALTQISIARSDLTNAGAALINTDENKAAEVIEDTIETLQAALRILRGW